MRIVALFLRTSIRGRLTFKIHTLRFVSGMEVYVSKMADFLRGN